MFNTPKPLIDINKLNEFEAKLYDYQIEAVTKVNKEVAEASEQMIGQIILPTGAGKTKIIEDLVPNFLNQIWIAEHRTAIAGVACHRLLLANNLLERIFQTLSNNFNIKNLKVVVVNSGNYDKFANEFSANFENLTGKDVVIYARDIKGNLSKFVKAEQVNGNHIFFVMLYQSMTEKYFKKLDFKFDFVFCDEAHITTEQNLHENLVNFQKNCNIVIHTTATPIDRGEIGMKNENVYGPVIIKKDPRELVFSKHIVPINMIMMEFQDENSNIITRESLYNDEDTIIKSIMKCSESCFRRVSENQEKSNIPEDQRKNGVFFVSVGGNKYLKKMLNGNGKMGKEFRAYLKKNNIDLYITSAAAGGNVDYPETDTFEHRNLNKDEFLRHLNMIGKERKNKSIIINIDQLSEGIDLPNINGVLITRQLMASENAAKLLQIIGRAVRRDDYDRKFINDNTVNYYDFNKFLKPCAYLYVPTSTYSKIEINDIVDVMLKLYPSYGEVIFHLLEKETLSGESSLIYNNEDGLKKLTENEIKNIYTGNLAKIPSIEKLINLLNNINITGEDKKNYIRNLIEKCQFENNEDLYNKIYEYAETKAHWNIDIIYDYITTNLNYF